MTSTVFVPFNQAESNRIKSTWLNDVNKVTYTPASVAALQALAIPDGAITVLTQGYYAAGDGGGALFRWDATSAAVDNGGTVIQPSSAPTLGRWLMIHNGRVNTQQFGVYHDGTNGVINQVRGQAAIDYCQDNLVILEIPRNAVSSAILITAAAGVGWKITKPLTFIGAGSRSVTLAGSGFGNNQYVLDVDGTAFGTFEQGKIGGFTILAGDSTADAMRIKNVSLSRFFDIGVRTCRRGFTYTGTRCFSNVFDTLYAVTAVAAQTFIMEGHGGGGHHSFYDCTFSGDTGFTIDVDTLTDSVNFYDCNFEGCITNSLFAGGEVSGLCFFGGRTEGCDSTDFQINPDVGLTISGLIINGVTFNSGDSPNVDRIVIGGSGGAVRGWTVEGCSVKQTNKLFTANLVQLNGEGESGEICNNMLEGALADCGPVNVLRVGVLVRGNEAKDGKFPDQNVPVIAGPQAIALAADAILAVGETVLISNTTAGSITLTSAPTIADAFDGQLVEIINVGTQNIVIQDQGTLASSNLRLTAATLTIAPRGSLCLRYLDSVGDWVQVGGLVTVL